MDGPLEGGKRRRMEKRLQLTGDYTEYAANPPEQKNRIASARTEWTRYANYFDGRPVCASQTRAVPSADAVTTRLAAASNCASTTSMLCPSGGA